MLNMSILQIGGIMLQVGASLKQHHAVQKGERLAPEAKGQHMTITMFTAFHRVSLHNLWDYLGNQRQRSSPWACGDRSWWLTRN